jgi:hypothetical protein
MTHVHVLPQKPSVLLVEADGRRDDDGLLITYRGWWVSEWSRFKTAGCQSHPRTQV